MKDFLELKEFYELMQLYRIADTSDQKEVIRRFDAVKNFIRMWVPKERKTTHPHETGMVYTEFKPIGLTSTMDGWAKISIKWLLKYKYLQLRDD